MLRLFVLAAIGLTGVDHWTTWHCLRAPIEGWAVSEANPIAGWLFEWAGLGAGLAIDSVLTLGAVLFLATTRVFASPIRTALLGTIVLSTAYAAINNLSAMSRMGLAPWSGGF